MAFHTILRIFLCFPSVPFFTIWKLWNVLDCWLLTWPPCAQTRSSGWNLLMHLSPKRRVPYSKCKNVCFEKMLKIHLVCLSWAQRTRPLYIWPSVAARLGRCKNWIWRSSKYQVADVKKINLTSMFITILGPCVSKIVYCWLDHYNSKVLWKSTKSTKCLMFKMIIAWTNLNKSKKCLPWEIYPRGVIKQLDLILRIRNLCIIMYVHTYVCDII